LFLTGDEGQAHGPEAAETGTVAGMDSSKSVAGDNQNQKCRNLH